MRKTILKTLKLIVETLEILIMIYGVPIIVFGMATFETLEEIRRRLDLKLSAKEKQK